MFYIIGFNMYCIIILSVINKPLNAATMIVDLFRMVLKHVMFSTLIIKMLVEPRSLLGTRFYFVLTMMIKTFLAIMSTQIARIFHVIYIYIYIYILTNNIAIR